MVPTTLRDSPVCRIKGRVRHRYFSVMTSPPEPTTLRRCALAVAVLHDLDVLPAIDGIVLAGSPPLEVSWAECRRALGGVDAETDDGRHRLARWLLQRRRLADRPLQDLY